MIKVVYFARLREQLGRGEDVVAWQPSLRTLDDLRRHLMAEYPEQAETLRAGDVLVARNQDMAAWNDTLTDGDEVALFPPVTGG